MPYVEIEKSVKITPEQITFNVGDVINVIGATRPQISHWSKRLGMQKPKNKWMRFTLNQVVKLAQMKMICDVGRKVRKVVSISENGGE